MIEKGERDPQHVFLTEYVENHLQAQKAITMNERDGTNFFSCHPRCFMRRSIPLQSEGEGINTAFLDILVLWSRCNSRLELPTA